MTTIRVIQYNAVRITGAIIVALAVVAAVAGTSSAGPPHEREDVQEAATPAPIFSEALYVNTGGSEATGGGRFEGESHSPEQGTDSSPDGVSQGEEAQPALITPEMVDFQLSDAPPIQAAQEVNAAAGPPAHTCCEQDTELNGKPKIRSEKTSVVDDTWRSVHIEVDVPIEVALANGGDPNQAGGAAPMDSRLTVTKWDDRHECGSGKHKAKVRVQYVAIYRSDAAVNGELKFDMTLPEGKGTINHSYAMTVLSEGNKLDVEPSNTDPYNPEHDNDEPVELPR